MKKVLFDINIWIDIALRRGQFPESTALFQRLLDKGSAIGFPLSGFTTFYYLLTRGLGKAEAIRFIQDASASIIYCPFTEKEHELALKLNLSDLEDACVVACGFLSGFNTVVTRNKKDFKTELVSSKTPSELLAEWH